MSERAEFSQATKDGLAKRAGYRCSFPGCQAPTIGPSEETDSSSSSSGMACHIAAAANGPAARRVVPIMGKEQLSDISNGIWMCYRHGKLIDTDEATYTIAMLQTWRRIAELRAQLSHQLGREVILVPKDLSDVPLPTSEFTIATLGAENAAVGTALDGSCVRDIWGEELNHAVRDVIIELYRNAMGHGGASVVRVRIEPTNIAVTDDGKAFDSLSLYAWPEDSGGARAIRRLSESFEQHVLFTSTRENSTNRNLISLLRSPQDIPKITDCTLELSYEDMRRGHVAIKALDDCQTVYVLLPSYFAMSDVRRLPALIRAAVPADREVVVVGRHISAGVVRWMGELFPEARFMSFEEHE